MEDNELPLSRDKRTVNGYVTDDSESDFVDVTDMEKYKIEKESSDASHQPEILVNGIPMKRSDVTVTVERSQTVRSSLKTTSSRLKDQEEGRKRTISFDLHDVKPQVSILPPGDEGLRHLFTSSRWSTSSTSSSEPDSLRKSTEESLDVDRTKTHQDAKSDEIASKEDTTLKSQSFEKSKATRLIAMKKSKSLKADLSRRSVDVIVKRRHSVGDAIPTQNTALRDSAIDLISDEENSEAYTAVSLAGTLKRNAQPVQSRGIQRKYVIIGAVTGFLAAVTIIVILSVLLASKK